MHVTELPPTALGGLVLELSESGELTNCFGTALLPPDSEGPSLFNVYRASWLCTLLVPS